MMPSSVNTRWSLVQSAKGKTPESRAALAELCEIYYRPVFLQVLRWSGDEDSAKELTQSFFARVLSGNQLDGANERVGRFRGYLYGAVRHFLIAEKRERAAEKRGGGAQCVDIEMADSLAADASSPDVEFDRAWACAALARALEALSKEMSASGRAETFVILKPWLAGDATHGATAAAAVKLGVSETAVRVQISRLRKRMRALLEETVAETLTPGADIQMELRCMVAALCK